MGTSIHATAVAIAGQGVLLIGKSGSGKSDLALRLIDRGAQLVSDDYTAVSVRSGRLIAAAPPTISGKLEIRGLGIVDIEPSPAVHVALVVHLDQPLERFPLADMRYEIMGISLASLSLAAHEASAPIKVEWALKAVGMS
jgi:serine kinase of HPr protein (carbohydrate metabolism regulator)